MNPAEKKNSDNDLASIDSKLKKSPVKNTLKARESMRSITGPNYTCTKSGHTEAADQENQGKREGSKTECSQVKFQPAVVTDAKAKPRQSNGQGKDVEKLEEKQQQNEHPDRTSDLSGIVVAETTTNGSTIQSPPNGEMHDDNYINPDLAGMLAKKWKGKTADKRRGKDDSSTKQTENIEVQEDNGKDKVSGKWKGNGKATGKPKTKSSKKKEKEKEEKGGKKDRADKNDKDAGLSVATPARSPGSAKQRLKDTVMRELTPKTSEAQKKKEAKAAGKQGMLKPDEGRLSPGRKASVVSQVSMGSRRSFDFAARLQAQMTANQANEKAEMKPMALVNESYIRAAIPFMPLCLALLFCFLNIFSPGFGTILSGISIFCCGRARVRTKDDHKPLTFCVNVLVGFCQLVTVTFCLVGWFWSIAWGVYMIQLALEWKEEKKRERKKEIQTLALSAFGNGLKV